MALSIPLEHPTPENHSYYTQENDDSGLVSMVGGMIAFTSTIILFFKNVDEPAPIALNVIFGVVCVLGSCCCLVPILDRLTLNSNRETPSSEAEQQALLRDIPSAEKQVYQLEDERSQATPL